MATPSPVELADRERQIVDDAAARGLDTKAILAIIAVDRAARWQQHTAEFVFVRPEAARWAESMTAAHGPTVQIWHVPGLSWIAALMVVRYGEAECHWPTGFSDDDVLRANRWLSGVDEPPSVQYEKGP